MTQPDDVPPTDADLIHRLRIAAEHELEVTPVSSPLHDWLAAEAEELGTAEAGRLVLS